MSPMEQIGPYRILNEIDRGGMAVVYRALQPSVNRIVALKVLMAPHDTDAALLNRFRHEAETCARLIHEHIIKVWDASVDSPPYYLTLEYLAGGTLAARLAQGPLSLREALVVITALCAALDYAHQRGVVHRDIKPANILFDADGRPVLTDFGIARASEHTRLTRAGAKFGTPEYMSPEQAKGLRVDPRSDVYSLGVVLYEMLAGRPPFLNDEPLVTLRQIIDEPVPSPCFYNRQLPRAIEGVLARALAKRPDDRFQSAGEFARALEAAVTNAPCESLDSVAAPRFWHTVTHFGATSRGRFALVVSLLMVGVIIGIGWLVMRGFGGSGANEANGPVVPPPLPPPRLSSVGKDNAGTKTNTGNKAGLGRGKDNAGTKTKTGNKAGSGRKKQTGKTGATDNKTHPVTKPETANTRPSGDNAVAGNSGGGGKQPQPPHDDGGGD